MTSEALVAEMIAQAIHGQSGSVGAIVRDVPFIEPASVGTELLRLTQEGMDLRIAYLQEGADAILRECGLPQKHVSAEVEQAERWRNQRELKALIVVVATGTEDKLSSLEDFSTVVSGDLKRLLVRRAQASFAAENEVQARWWTLLEQDESISFAQLLDYYLALAQLAPADVVTRSSRELYRLGLLPDPAFFDGPSESALRKRLQLNRDLVQRLQTFTDRDRKTAVRNLASVTDSQEHSRLREVLRQLKQLRRGNADLTHLTLRDAQLLIDVRKPKKKRGGTTQDDEPGDKVPLAAHVASFLLEDPDSREDLEKVVQEMYDKLNSLSEVQSRTETISIPSGTGGEIVSEARGDVVNLVAKLVGEGRYGALLEGSEGDLQAMIRHYHAKPQPIKHWTRQEVEPLLDAATEVGVKQVGELFHAYDAARDDCLPLVRLLCVDPLAAAVAPSSRAKLRAVVDKYQALLKGLSDVQNTLSNELGADAQELVAQLLLLDTIIFRRPNGELVALLAPTHPLYLWHYTEYARVVEEQRHLLSPRDQLLVTSAATKLPYFLTSLCIPSIAVDSTASLTLVDRLGPLPVYGQTVRDRSGTDGMSQIKRAIVSFLDIHPTARMGLRLTVVNAPDPGAFLSLLADLTGERTIDGAFLLAVHQARDGAKPPPLQFRPDEEERVAQLFRSSGPRRRFTFQSMSVAEGELQLPSSAQPHILVVFDQSEGTANRVMPASHPIQPLAVTHKLQYRYRTKLLELTPAPGGIFAAYNQVVGIVNTVGQVSYFSVHQQGKLRRRLAEAAEQATWFVVADRSVDRDLSIGALRVFTGSADGRDVVAFTRRTDAFRRVLRDVARQYNTAISDSELDALLRDLADLLDEGIFTLRPDANGRTNPQRVKGLLGMLVAVRAFRAKTATGHERLIISLDSSEARRWLHLSDDPQRADLVGFDYADERFTITVIEAKAVESSTSEYQVRDGIVSGQAVEQLLSTRRLLAQVFAPSRDDELITTPARREVVREHAFRELSKATYTPEARKAWSDRLEQLFSGSTSATINCEIAEVLLGRDSTSLQARNVRALEGDAEGAELVSVSIRQLNEIGIDALRQRTAPTKIEEPAAVSSTEPTAPTEARSPSADAVTPRVGPQQAPSAPSAPGVPAALRELTTPSPEPQPMVSTGTPEIEERPRAFIGEAPGTYGKAREIWFDPQLPGKSLPNPHILITGETGSGKTQATKALIRDLRSHGIPALILDFKDDYSQLAYVEEEDLKVFDASAGELAFDPMVPPLDPQTGRIAVLNHIYALTEIVKRIYSLGDQQANRMRESLKELYLQAGIRLQAHVPDIMPSFPPFDKLRAVLEQGRDNDALLGRLSPIFDLGLFAAVPGQGGFESLAKESAVIRLSQLPGDETKNATAEFFLMALYNFLIRQPHPHALRRLLVLDEAWRLVKSPFLQPLMREGRAFGLGVIIATQFPGDMPDEVSGSTATKMYFSQTKSENIREVQRALIGKTSGADAHHLAAAMRELPPMTCFFQNSQYQPHVRTTVHPYYARLRGE